MTVGAGGDEEEAGVEDDGAVELMEDESILGSAVEDSESLSLFFLLE